MMRRMNRKLLAGIVVVALAAVGVWWFGLRGHDKAKPAGATAGRSGEVTPTGAKPREVARPAPARGASPWILDEDPEGKILLEGQVQGPDGAGVGGAKVWITSVPPRTTTTEADGSFSFDKLVGRTYVLGASSGDLIGGPLQYKVTDNPDPVVLRLVEGATVIATVTDEGGKPIADAEVSAREEEPKAKTDAEGKATLKPVRPGWINVEAKAAGYAQASALTTIGSAGATGHVAITLRKGFGVTGKVVDEAGAPVAKARVSVAPGLWGMADSSETVTTDAEGVFALAAIPPGTSTLQAIDGEHAPARSAPITITDRAITDVVITMKAGARLAGIVVDPSGKPVPYVAVRVAAKGADAWWGRTARQTTTGADGKFALRGLPRLALQVRAEADTSASKIADVSLVDAQEVNDLKLVLDVAGQISGVVVDDTGAPVPEVSVNTFPDFLNGKGNTEGLALAGMESATTDGAGAFTLHGLTEGAYKVWATRSTDVWQEWGQNGVPAKTGDTNVRVVLASPGEVKGTIVLDGANAAPFPASISLGRQTPTPAAADGTFSLREVPPGTYDATFRGAQFAELVQRDIKVEPGKTTDLGKVVVFRGRRLTGKVVDKSGEPVSGAKVRVAEFLVKADGAAGQADAIDQLSGVRTAYTDQHGEFSIIGIKKTATNAIAEHPDRGSSMPVAIAEGTDDPPPITLTLRGYGSIAGKATVKGQPVSGLGVSYAIKGASGSTAFAQTGDDGSYTLSKVPEGQIVLSAVQQGMMTLRSASMTVNVVAGKQTIANIDIPKGELSVTITVKAQAGAQVDAAQVFVMAGAAAYANAKQLTDAILQGGAQGMKFWLGKDSPMPTFDELVAGDYSVCTIPITGNLADPQFQQRIQQNLTTLKVYCKAFKLKPSPPKQEVVHEVPAMTPLP
jgi:protocatechuate 3,4-dioxygenase beta subunit